MGKRLYYFLLLSSDIMFVCVSDGEYGFELCEHAHDDEYSNSAEAKVAMKVPSILARMTIEERVSVLLK